VRPNKSSYVCLAPSSRTYSGHWDLYFAPLNLRNCCASIKWQQ